MPARYGEAVAAADDAKKWCWIASCLGIPANIVFFVMQMMSDPEMRHLFK